MHQEIVPKREPTPRDYRRAATAILIAAIIQAAIGYWFQASATDENRHTAAAWLFYIIAVVDLFVGSVVMAYSGRGGSPGALRKKSGPQ